MGKRSKKLKSLNVLKNLMGELSLGSCSENTNTTNPDDIFASTESQSVSTKTKHFILAPSHPFYWHLSNRENRPKDAEESSTSEYPDSGSQSEGRLVISKVKNVKKKHKIRRRLKKNKIKTSDLTTSTSITSSDKLNRKQAKQAKRTAKKLRSQKVKRRIVNKGLANELNQLSLG